MAAASQLKPRGETPLIRSMLKTVGDLKAAGGGSVILITDGEESCKGDPKTAARQDQGSGVNVTLNIVGFTLTGKQVETRARRARRPRRAASYYGAQDGQQLSRAVKLAALQRLPYDMLDKSGRVRGVGGDERAGRELPPGSIGSASTRSGRSSRSR